MQPQYKFIEMITCAVIDDEPWAVALLRDYISKTDFLKLQFSTSSAIEGLQKLQEQPAELVFLDIQMPELTGIQFMKINAGKSKIILTTAYSEYALDGYEHNVVDYLLKPFSKERFDKALQKWLQKYPDPKTAETLPIIIEAVQNPLPQNRIVVKSNNKIKIIPLPDIQYLEAADDYVKIHTAEGQYLKNKTMAYFEQLLDIKQFVRTHRSYIVNVQFITRLEPYEKENYLAMLNTGEKVPVSKTGYVKLKQVLGL